MLEGETMTMTQEDCDELFEQTKLTMNTTIKSAPLIAKLERTIYQELIKQGFTEEQALMIICRSTITKTT